MVAVGTLVVSVADVDARIGQLFEAGVETTTRAAYCYGWPALCCEVWLAVFLYTASQWNSLMHITHAHGMCEDANYHKNAVVQRRFKTQARPC